MDDPSFSRECLSWQTKLACRVCDPEVGVGLKQGTCPSLCDAWYDACKAEYFAFTGQTAGALVPCGEAGSAGALLCSRLGNMAANGREACEAAGLAVAPAGSDEPCYSGEGPHRTDFCVKPPKGYGGGARGRGRQQGGGEDAEEVSTPVYFLGAVVVASLLWLSYTTVKGIRAREAEQMRQLHWRQLHGRDD